MRSTNRRTIALIANDGKKPEMVNFARENIECIRHFHIVATGTTGHYLEKAGLHVQKMMSGPQGGDVQIASMIVEGKIDGVIFLRDPLGLHPHEPDIFMLLRIADMRDIPIATNLASATLLIRGLDKGFIYHPVLAEHKKTSGALASKKNSPRLGAHH